MLILGIDTATAIASAALVKHGKLVLDVVCGSTAHRGDPASVSPRPNHAETILPAVAKLLERSGTSLANISALAVSIGPGSFTGLRIGLSTVKGLAYGSDIPVVGVSTLWAVAARVNHWEGWICPILDARKNEVYSALFRRSARKLERVTEDVVLSPNKMVERISSSGDSEPCLFIGDGIKVYGELIERSLGARAVLTLGEDYDSTASAVARLAEEKIRNGAADPLGPLVPLYLRPSEAERK